MATGTVEDIINDAMSELGLPVQDFSGSLGELASQSLALLNALCRQLWRQHDWQFLQNIATFTGDGATTEFTLPSDWGRQLTQTGWDATGRRQLAGPVSPAEWGWLQYGITAVGIYYRYRILNDKFAVYPTPPTGTSFKLAYVKSSWATQAGTSARVANLTAGGDVPDFPRDLLTSGVKLRLWSIKGFDTTQLDEEYNTLLGMVKVQNQGARIINLSGRDERFLIDPIRNLDEGNW